MRACVRVLLCVGEVCVKWSNEAGAYPLSARVTAGRTHALDIPQRRQVGLLFLDRFFATILFKLQLKLCV